MTSLHSDSTSINPAAAAARRAVQRRFLGEELSPAEPTTDTPWLVKAVLSGSTRVELDEDGVIPARVSGVLPLRHGLSSAGTPASCLLHVPGLARLRRGYAGVDTEVECAACRAWQKTNGIVPVPRRRLAPATPPTAAVMARLRAALDDVFSKAA